MTWLVIQNHGPGAAYEIHVEPTADMKVFKDTSLRKLGIIAHGLSYLAPGAEYRTFIGTSHEILSASRSTDSDVWIDDIHVAISCKTRWKTTIQTTSILTFPDWHKPTTAMADAKKSLERIAKALEKR